MRWHINAFEKYAVYILIQPNNETGESKLKNIDERQQENYNFINNNSIDDEKWIQIHYKIREAEYHIIRQWYYNTWINYIPLPLLKYKNMTAMLQKGGIRSEYFTSEEAICMNAYWNLVNIYECTMNNYFITSK